MKTSDFNYDLPNELIADYPLESRSKSRLLVYMNEIEHKSFTNILDYLNSGDLLVLNNTSVIPARIFGKKDSGGLVEVLLERFMEDNKALVQIRSGNSPKIGTRIYLEDYETVCTDRKDNFFIIQFNSNPIEVFNKIGHIPLPPYIKRKDEELDKLRYATVYENKDLQNSVAAPTAGLHFDKELLDKIKRKGVNISNINLSVGAGTFQPVKVDDIKDHDIHEEFVEVEPSIIDKVKKTKEEGNKVIAVGTTATRALETAFLNNKKGFRGYTKLFIYPGFKFKAVDLLITNFHLPRSSLLMLVSAFIGFNNMKEIYKKAVEEKYRFLSYGDAMLLKKNEI
jgi:S-adenosylmethionine:tRNA ribosyltransferase-isomerase